MIMDKQRCIICRKPINNGIMINGRIICKSCEDRLVKADVDTDLYDYYTGCIRKTMVGTLLRDEVLNFHEDNR